MFKYLTLTCLFIASASATTLTDYWSFNTNSLAPNIGNTTLTSEWTGTGLDIQGWGSGTTVNTQLDYPAGTALSHGDILAGFTSLTLTFQNLNFQNRSNVELSFATIANKFFVIGETTSIYYNLGSSWQLYSSIQNPSNTWTTRIIEFGSLLDNQTNASLRIRTTAIFEATELLSYDNVVISSVPEPSYMLGICVLLTILLFIRKMRA